jgi:hypothetical protein
MRRPLRCLVRNHSRSLRRLGAEASGCTVQQQAAAAGRHVAVPAGPNSGAVLKAVPWLEPCCGHITMPNNETVPTVTVHHKASCNSLALPACHSACGAYLVGVVLGLPLLQ